MGREIRKVPLDWEHPKGQDLEDNGLSYGSRNHYPDRYTPVHDESYIDASKEWIAGLSAWKDEETFFWEEEGNPPDKAVYRFGKWDFKPEDAVCFQIYETVSEGTPISPVFETLDAMKEWLVAEGYSESQAQAFINAKWAPSMAMIGGITLDGIEAAQ